MQVEVKVVDLNRRRKRRRKGRVSYFMIDWSILASGSEDEEDNKEDNPITYSKVKGAFSFQDPNDPFAVQLTRKT